MLYKRMQIIIYGLYSFDLKDLVRMAPLCRNMWEINSYRKFYFIKFMCWLMY